MAAIVTSVRLLLVAATLTACSSAGGTAVQVPPVQSLANGGRQGADGSLVMRIHISRKKKTRRAAPRYISPATAAITISITGLADVKKTAALTPDARGLFARVVHGDDSWAKAVSVFGELLRSDDRNVRCSNGMPIRMHDP